MIYIPKWRHVRRRGSILCAITQHGWKEISSMKRTTKKTLFVFVLIAAMMLSIFPAAAFAEGAAAVEPAAQTEQQPEKDAAPAAKDDGAKPAEPAKGDGAKPAEPVKDGENKAEPVKNDEKSVVVEGKDGEKPADPAFKDGEERETSTYLDISGGKDLPAPDVAATLNYDANGGTGAPKSESKSGLKGNSATFTVSSTTPTRDGYTFKGWNTKADGSGMEYKAGNSISVAYGSTTTLYAQWEETPGPSPDPGGDDDKQEATLVFDPNAGTDTVDNMPVPNPMTGTPEEGKQNVSFTIPTTPPTRDNFEFQGWNTAADKSGTSYQPGDNIDVPVGTTGTLYAIWGDKQLEIDKAYAVLVYDGNGDNTAPVTGVPDSATSDAGNVGTNHEFTVSDAVPVREGYTFKGWTVDKNGTGTVYQGNDKIDVAYGSTTTLYAQWEMNLETKLVYDANANDATNVKPSEYVQKVPRGGKAQFIVTSDKPTRPGYTFAGWSIIPDAEVAYNPDSVVEVEAGAEMILYAVWVKNVKLEIIYNGNADGVQNIPGPDVEWVEPNGSFVFTIANGPTRPGYRFVEWNSADNGTGDSIKPGQTTRLYAGEKGYSKTYYAKWEPEEVTPIDWGKLGISKSVSPTGPVKPGTTLTYTITVTNNTGADLDSVVVYDKLDRHLAFVSVTGAGSYSTRTCFWTVAPLANGDSATLVIQATVNAGTADKTVIYNTASVLAASAGNEALKVGSGPSASANVAVTNPGSGTWGGTTWGKGVQTGDDANLGLWIAAMIVSFLCVAVLVYVNRKRIFKGKANNK